MHGLSDRRAGRMPAGLRSVRKLAAVVATVALTATALIGIAPAAGAATSSTAQRASAVAALRQSLPSVKPMHAEDGDPYKVLVFSKTAGFRHTDGIVAG